MTASPISLGAEIRLRRALRGAAARYLAARSRPTTPDRHLAAMEGAWVAWVQTAVAAGMTPAEIGGAAGISDPPAVLGLDDAEEWASWVPSSNMHAPTPPPMPTPQ